MTVYFKKSSLSKEANKTRIAGYGLGSRGALEGTVRTKKRAERMRKLVIYWEENSYVQDVHV